MKHSLISFVFTVFFVFTISAQENNKDESKNFAAASFGYTYVPEGSSIDSKEITSVFVPTVGLKYGYRFSPKWEIGLMTVIELSDYLLLDANLHREKAFLVTLGANYLITRSFNVFAAGGVEFEQHKHLPIFRLGMEYKFFLKNEWFISPEFVYDFKDVYNTFSLSISFGKEF